MGKVGCGIWAKWVGGRKQQTWGPRPRVASATTERIPSLSASASPKPAPEPPPKGVGREVLGEGHQTAHAAEPRGALRVGLGAVGGVGALEDWGGQRKNINF